MKHTAPIEGRTKRGNMRYFDELRNLSKQNRNHPTAAEYRIWNEVLKNRSLGYKFLRQKPIGRFIVDFYCSKLLLAIEVDGESHIKKKYYDNERDKHLNWRNIKTIRFANYQVLHSLDDVKNTIQKAIHQREQFLSLNSPLFEAEGPAVEEETQRGFNRDIETNS
jgi:very-short-patch-repair endonuclease